MAQSQEQSLTPFQLEALFNILTHAQSSSEVRDLRYETLMPQFGPPVTPALVGPSAFPLMQNITNTFVPPNILSESGWRNQLTMFQRLGAANLSDSYDKGFFGLRKNAAAGLSTLLESLARGLLAGLPRNPNVDLATLHTKPYNKQDAKQLEQAWDDAVQGMVYGGLLDQVFDAVKASPELDFVPPVATAALDYYLICAATMMHYSLVITPEGQNLVKMMDIVHTLTPYTILKQTLRMANIQSILDATVKIMLAKVNDKNLVQTMISRTLKLDLSDLEKRAEKLKKNKEVPKEIADALDDYVNQPRAVQQITRQRSQDENISIVTSILSGFYPVYPPEGVKDMAQAQHTAALEYLSLRLSIRDRRQGIQAICKEKPDLLSDIIKESMTIIEPFLKILHDGKFDLGKTVNLQKAFTEDFIKTAKITKNHTPGVADFFALLKRQLPLAWSTLHEASTRCPALHGMAYEWCRDALEKFRSTESSPYGGDLRTCAMTGPLLGLFNSLGTQEREAVLTVLNDQSYFITRTRAESRRRLQDVLDKRCTTDSIGPGPVLPRWHGLLDTSTLTATTPRGQPRTGRSLALDGLKVNQDTEPDCKVVLDALAEPFKQYLKTEKSSALSMSSLAGSLPTVGSYSEQKTAILTTSAVQI